VRAQDALRMELAINIDVMSMMSAVGHTPSCNGGEFRG